MIIDRATLAAIARQLRPDAGVIDSWSLRGGLSAQLMVLSLEHSDGRHEQVVVRQIGASSFQHTPDVAVTEFAVLQTLHQRGLAVPMPYLLDQSRRLLPTPYLVMEYIAGQPRYTLPQPLTGVRQIAEQLAAIHRVPATGLAELPAGADRVAALLSQRPATLDDSLCEGQIRAVLERGWPRTTSTLLHGDFWPGNIVWCDDAIVGVVDWEDAALGDPLMDLAISRLDVLWLFGRDAMQALTQHHQRRTNADLTWLPFWDLYAALRPAGRLSKWAAGWPALGRPD